MSVLEIVPQHALKASAVRFGDIFKQSNWLSKSESINSNFKAVYRRIPLEILDAYQGIFIETLCKTNKESFETMRIGSWSLLLSWHWWHWWQECPFFPCPKTTIFKSHRVSSHSSEETTRLSSCQRTHWSVDGKQIFGPLLEGRSCLKRQASLWRYLNPYYFIKCIWLRKCPSFMLHLTLSFSCCHGILKKTFFWHVIEQRWTKYIHGMIESVDTVIRSPWESRSFNLSTKELLLHMCWSKTHTGSKSLWKSYIRYIVT